MKWSIKGYKFPTPAVIRKWSNAAVAACGSVSGIAFIADFKVMAQIVLIIAFVGKLFSVGYYNGEEEKQ